MSALNFPVAVLATEVIQSIAIGIVYLICVGLMLVPVVGFATLVFVEARALRAERQARRSEATPRIEVATQVAAQGGAR